MSLRLRLLVATGVAMLFGLIVLDVVTYVMVSRSQIQQVDAALERAHQPVEQLASSARLDDRLVIPSVAPGLFVAIIGQTGEVEYTTAATAPDDSDDSDDNIAEPVGGEGIDVLAIERHPGAKTVPTLDGDEMRIRVDRIRRGSTLIIGQSLHEVNETRTKLLGVLIGGSAIAIAIASALAWWLLRAGLTPLRRVEASAAAITDSALADQRVPGADRRTEVGRLATTLNEMLDRLEQASNEREASLEELRISEARMRRFVADASHELRTPIAATSAYAELFEQGARDRPDDLERAMAGIRDQTGRMAALVDDLLLLARLDENRPMADEHVDMTELVLQSIDAARTLEPDRVVRPHISGVVTVAGDPLRLRQVVDNLLANVRSHTPSSVSCDVTLTEVGEHIVLEVADSGPGVQDYQLDRLFDRFYRVDDARTRTTGGSGLGLSIVHAIIEAHGGAMTASKNDPHGLIVTVQLPRVETEPTS
jgi:two-component system OmpR family sensor kinase